VLHACLERKINKFIAVQLEPRAGMTHLFAQLCRFTSATMRALRLGLTAMTCVAPAAGIAEETAAPEPQPSASTSQSICMIVESAASANQLPLDFFARVIWQESRFQADAVGPPTRSGARAQGIAQFMPGTAAERGLLDPFDPIQALPKSAQFLSELRAEFGSLGLAAAAYNAGPQRLRDYLAGRGGMPAETRAYVLAITGRPLDDWAKAGTTDAPPERSPNCQQLVALLKRAPNPFVRQLEERVAVVAAAPWGVQLSAGFSRDAALRSYAAIAKRHAAVLQGHDPSIIASRWLSRGTRTFYQVRIGANTRQTAENLCESIRRVQGACLVLRNRS
jgi:soluble lytic murein transglycosylase-like protein